MLNFTPGIFDTFKSVDMIVYLVQDVLFKSLNKKRRIINEKLM